MPRPSESSKSESLPTTMPRPQRPPRSSLPVRSSRSPSLSSLSRSSLGMMRPTWSLWRRKLGPSRRTVSYGVPPSSFPSVTVSPCFTPTWRAPLTNRYQDAPDHLGHGGQDLPRRSPGGDCRVRGLRSVHRCCRYVLPFYTPSTQADFIQLCKSSRGAVPIFIVWD